MNWNSSATGLDEQDLVDVFEYESGYSKVFEFRGDPAVSTQRELENNADWTGWLDERHFSLSDEKGLGVVLAGRLEDDPVEGIRDPTIISTLPFSKDVFSSLAEMLTIHGSIARAINRSTECLFSNDQVVIDNTGERAFVYNCRSSSSWDHDLAASVTWFPGRNFSYAVFYGCAKTSPSRRHRPVIQRIARRLDHAGEAIHHPMLVPGIFAEIERERHIGLVSKHQTVLLKTVTHLSNQEHWKDIPAVNNRAANNGANSQSDEYYIDPWLHVSHLKNGLENWKEQLQKMVEHVDELSTTVFLAADQSQSTPFPLTSTEEEKFKERMRNSGHRIKRRLLEIIFDYNEHIRACETTMQGMTLATQLAYTKVSMQISAGTKRDGSHMRQIAFLTMIFLPATFLATFFSMTFFDWRAESSKIVTPWLGIYFLLVLLLTGITMASWYCFVARRARSRRQRDEEAAQQGQRTRMLTGLSTLTWKV